MFSAADTGRQVRSAVVKPSRQEDTLSFSIIGQQEAPVFRFEDGDTIFQEPVYNNQTSVPDLFWGHHLQPVNEHPIPVHRRTADWFTMTLLFVIVSFSWIKVFYSKIFRQLIAAFFS